MPDWSSPASSSYARFHQLALWASSPGGGAFSNRQQKKILKIICICQHFHQNVCQGEQKRLDIYMIVHESVKLPLVARLLDIYRCRLA